MRKLRASRAVFREKDDRRLEQRLAAVAGQDLAANEVLQLAGGDLSLIQQLDAPAQQGVMALVRSEALSDNEAEVRGALEKMVGPSLDYVSVAFLARAQAAARTVARVVFLDGRQEHGSGVMVSPSLFMTNNHVIKSPDQALDLVIQFDYELGVDDAPLTITEYRLDPVTFFFTSDEKDLDVTVVAVGRALTGSRALSDFGYAALRSGDDKHAEGDFVTIIQHPEGRHKQIALRENRVIGRGKLGRTLHYGADTLPGASGSPVFNDSFELVALHHAGGFMNDQTLEDGKKIPKESNEGIRISAIMTRLRRGLNDLAAPERALLAEAMDPPFKGPSLLVRPGRNEVSSVTSASLGVGLAALAPGGPGAVIGPDGWARVTLPVEVAVRVSEPGRPTTGITAAAGPATAAATWSLERNDPPDPTYRARRGYSEDFLGVEVPMPGLSKAAKKSVAVPDKAEAGDAALHYMHFSVVQHAERRMPFFTAVNIDGRRSRSVNRKTGEVEAAEKWYEDPRIDPGHQLVQDIFARQSPRVFDRGHLVRRLDPAWGSRSVAKRASDDTFHFTNCCPQVSTFNQSAKIWQGIEDYVLSNARAAEERITVFSGPFFWDDDPEFRGIRVPKAFWKVLVRMEAKEIRSTGFIASQEDLLEKFATEIAGDLEAFRDWADLGRVKVYQDRVARIEELTGLAFGELADHDTASALETVRTELASLEDTVL